MSTIKTKIRRYPPDHQNPKDDPPIEPIRWTRFMTVNRTRTFFRLEPARLFMMAGIAALLLAACQTAPVPLSDQEVLDRTNLRLPDTYPPGSPARPRMARVLRSMGFEWNDSRYTLGHHLIRENEVAWFDRGGNLHITRYIGYFKETGYRIRRYVPAQSGDLEHRGSHVMPGLLRCLFNRPASAIHWHKQLSSVDLLAEMALGAPIDLLITPVSLPVCLFSNRMPSTYLHAEKEEDEHAVKEALKRYNKTDQKGKPIPT